MARIFDVIEYPSEMRDEIVHRFPETGDMDIRIGSQLIVRESQAAVFFRDGRALDVLGPGRHTLTTANIPLLTGLVGKVFGDRTPFLAEVYFVSMREFADEKWGTPQPIIVKNPGVGLGIALLQGFGTYSFQVNDPQQFVTQDDFLAIGLLLKSFYVANLKPSDKSAEELRSMGMLDMQTYSQLQAADAMREAAQNPSGGAGLTAGLGAGMGLGNVMAGTLANMQQGQSAAGAASASTPLVPDVMTPDEAAQYLKVSAEDVMAAINAGDLKARKIGNSLRISKDALNNFLNGN